jgi:hypothetical protein
MADIDFPTTLRPHLVSGYSRTTTQQLAVNNLSAGAPVYYRITPDQSASWTVKFIFNQADAEIFENWIVNDIENGVLPFNMVMDIEAGQVEQEVYFSATGMPQLTKQEAGLYHYSATVVTEEINDPDSGAYSLLLWFAEDAPDNDPNTSMSLLDIIVTQQMTAASEV